LCVRKKIIEKIIVPFRLLTFAVVLYLVLFYFLDYVKLNPLESAISLGIIFGPILIIRKYLRLGLKKVQYYLHHIDDGSYSKKPGEEKEAKEEKQDEACLYYGSIILIISAIVDLTNNILNK